MATTDTAEAVRQMRADARTRRLVGLNSAGMEPCDDLVDAHQMVNCWATRDRAGPHVALEEAWREAVRYPLKNICLPENLTECDAVSISLLPLVVRVGAEDDRVAVVAVRLRDGGLKSGKEGVLHAPHHGPPHVPAAAVEAFLVDDALALDDKAA